MPKFKYIVALLLACLTKNARAQSVPSRVLVAVRSEAAVQVDGRATDPVWSKAPRSGSFIERNPNLGEKPPVWTTIQASYDDSNLYFLVQGELAHEKAKVRTLRRDSGDIFSDDTVSIKIDPRFDRRTVYAFAANLAGAQFDSLTLEDGRVNFRRWDGVWEVVGRQTGTTITLEYKIPFYVLGIKRQKDSKPLKMGFNVTRMDPARAADYDWRLIPPPRSPVGASTFGTLEGVKTDAARPVLELTPYALGTTDFSRRFSVDPTKQANLRVGADLRFQTGPGAYVEGSVLTDFSQVDVDQVMVANDRFPLYFPEQRPFFLNGADVFNFGHAQTAQLFFTRKVALADVASPILAGIKAYGRQSKLTYGVMNVQTAKVLDSGGEQKPAENFSAVRLRTQPIRQVAIGLLGVGRKVLSKNGNDALSLGIDLDLQTRDGRFRSYSFLASSWNENKRGTSLSNRTEYRSLYVRPAVTWVWSDPKFSAPLGFYQRPNTAQHEAEVNFVPRPDFWGLRDVEIRPRFTVVTSPDYRSRLTYEGRMDLALHFKTNWHAGYFFKGVQDKVSSEFSLFGDQIVSPGAYEHRTHTVWLDSPGHLPVSGGLSYEGGQRFGGSYHRLDGSINLRAGRHILAKGSYTHFMGKMPNATRPFGLGIANAQLVGAVNTKLVFDTLFRLDLTPGQKLVGTQARMRWRFRPGSDLFVVYANQQSLQAPMDPSEPRSDHRLTLKLNWYLGIATGRR